jgi:hypothetical protein
VTAILQKEYRPAETFRGDTPHYKMNHTPRISIQDIKSAVKPHLSSLVRDLLPGCILRNGKFWSLNPTRADRHLGSFWVCSGSGIWRDHAVGDGGDILDLVCYVKRFSKKDALNWLASWLGMSEPLQSNAPALRETADLNQECTEPKIDLARLLSGTVNPAGTPVERYLELRGLTLDFENIFHHPNWRYRDEFECQCTSPAMVALLHDLNGRCVGVHATVLTHQGQKRLDSKGKKITRLRSAYLLSGSAVRLSPAGPVLGVGEGIETSLSLGCLFNIPVWSCCNAELLAKVQLPPLVQKIFIAVDNDVAGRTKSTELAKRLVSENRSVVLVHASKLGVPDKGDLNDYLKMVRAS